MTALALIEDWDVGQAAAAVLGPAGVVETFGDQTRAFPLASVTKLLTAYSVLIAVEEGGLHLDDPAGPPGSTVRHLLAHTAGYGFNGDAVHAAPGRRRIYSNRGYEEAARHLTAATDIEFGEYLAEAVLHPLGMTQARLAGSPAHGLSASVADLVRFAAELLDPRLVAPVTWHEMTEVSFPGLTGVLPGHGRFDPLDWGLGPERNFGRSGHWGGSRVSTSTFGHFGGSGTFCWVDPDARLACVCLTDTPFGSWSRTAWPELNDAIAAERIGIWPSQ